MNMRMIKADIMDAQAIGFIHSIAWKQTYANIFPKEYLDMDTSIKREQEFRDSYYEENICYYIIHEGEKNIGIVKICKWSEKYEIESFYILEEYRGVGYGKQVLDYLKNAFNDSQMQLWVLEENSRARYFYEKNGFGDTGETRIIYRGKYYKQLLYTL